MRSQRGTTLPELLVVTAILVLFAILGLDSSQSSRAYAVQSAAIRFDASLAYARAVASTSGNGATLVFAPLRDGFELAVLSGRPDGASTPFPADVPPAASQAAVREATLGAPPFAVFLDSAGHASGLGAYPAFKGGTAVFAPVAAEPRCPLRGKFTLTFTDGSAATVRTLACRP